jgi:transposase
LVTNESKKGNIFIKEYDSRIRELNEKIKKSQEPEITLLREELKNVKKEKSEKMKQVTAEKNPLIQEFELKTPKEIRANAVKQCCDGYKAAWANLKNGNIKKFNINFREKKNKRQGIELQASQISISDGFIRILPKSFQGDCLIKVHRRMKKKLIKNNIQIRHNVDLIRENNRNYFLHIVIPTIIENKKDIPKRFAGIDLGIRTFATVYSNDLGSELERNSKIYEYNHKIEKLINLNEKIHMLNTGKKKKRKKKRQLEKCEKRKKDLVDSLHWDFINDCLKENDVIFLGDIKSQRSRLL